MKQSSLLHSAYRDSPLEAWYPEVYRELAAELAFARSRRRALLCYPLLLLRSLRRSDQAAARAEESAGAAPSESLVGRIDDQGQARAGLPPLPAALLPLWRSRYLAEKRETPAPTFACRRGPGGVYLLGGTSAFFEYELARTKGARPGLSPRCDGAALRECAPSRGRQASLLPATRR